VRTHYSSFATAPLVASLSVNRFQARCPGA